MPKALLERVQQLDWELLASDLHSRGYTLTPPLLSARECAGLIRLYRDDTLFRSHIIMSRYRFGLGDYKYFQYPLPRIVAELREHLYPHLAAIANRWNQWLGVEETFPVRHSELLKLCSSHGQARPTPLLLHYEAGDYNCLHQDIYGEIAFPLQATCFLSQKDDDFTGGEFVLMEQQPRAQSKAEVIAPERGQMLIFTTRYRPVKGSRGYYRVNMKHGVSRLRSGTRYTLGIIFHDAE